MSESHTPRRFKTKGFTSLLLTFSFLVVAFTGTILYFSPKGKVANWTGWTMLGLQKEQWSAVHICAGLLLLIVAGVHLYLNWGIFWSYLNKKTVAGIHLKWELAAALLIVAGVAAGAYFNLPPCSVLVRWNDQIKVYWARRAVAPPIPHAEDLSLAEFAEVIELSVDDMLEALRKEGFAVNDTQVKVKHLAEGKGVAPSDVHTAVVKHFPQAASKPRRSPGALRGSGPQQGRGRGSGAGQHSGR